MMRSESVSRRRIQVAAAVAVAWACALAPSPSAYAQANALQPGPVWPKLSQGERDQVMTFGEEFKQFIGSAKSSLTFVREATKMVEAAGFRSWPKAPTKAAVTPGSRWYAINRDRTIVAFVIGREPMTAGARIVNTHNDSVFIGLKPKPMRESFDLVLLDTIVHGGIKNYQWVNRPLAMIGRVMKTDGTVVTIDVGHASGDPVLTIPDLAPHVDNDFRERRNRDVIQTEELDPLLATTAAAAAEILKSKYNLTPEDFLSADIQIVPAQGPVDIGLDRQLIGAYGHDDRSNGYAAFRAIAETSAPQRTAIAYGVNNEEVNSWTTGVDSEWFRTLIAEIIAAQEPVYNDLMLRHALRSSQVLVSDCTTALDPNFPQPYLPNSSARLGWGLVFKEYGEGREADAEYFAKVRGIFNDAGVRWQTHAYRAGYGGGTIAQWFANADIDAIDVGIGLLSMHSPMDISSKVDLWELYRGFKAFLATTAAASTR
ncbi:MAG: aminopeptidase 1 [Acidimicrobiia bacterium]|nr:aminopeptidase 1 [Acidimicrobiia bacterium]